jgi:hypothetical protein
MFIFNKSYTVVYTVFIMDAMILAVYINNIFICHK